MTPPAARESDKWVKCISSGGGIRGVAIQARQLVQDNLDCHELNDASAQALGEALIGALFFAAYSKSQGRVNIKVSGSKQWIYAFVDAYPSGTARGYLVERPKRRVTPVSTSQGSLEAEPPVTGPWGEGLMSVLWMKGMEASEEAATPYVGAVPLVTGHFSKDLSFYWAQSEQVPSAVGIAVKVEKGKVISAGGFLIQALGGASPEEITQVEEAISGLPNLNEEFRKNPDPMHVLSSVLKDFSFSVLESKPIRFDCNCTQERVENAVLLLGKAELTDVLDKEKKMSVKCDFCSRDYSFDESALRKLLKMISD